MAIKPLSSLTLQDKDGPIQVQVNRKWEFRGNTDDGPIMHIDMILTESTGDAIYAEIPGYLAEKKGPLFDVTKVYTIRRFIVASARRSFRIVDASLMIRITPYTIVEVCRSPPSTFPEYIYHLISYNEVDPHGSKAKDFHDVLGIITDATQLQPIRQATQSTSTVKRDIFIQDLSDNIMKITLWGNKARRFSYEPVYDAQKKNPIVALFVGCLPKDYSGGIYLSGGAACHWYFNPKIPEAEPYYKRIMSEHITSPLPSLQNDEGIIDKPVKRKLRTLDDLLSSNPYDLPQEGCEITVTITKVPENNTWWYVSCSRCPNKATLESTKYQCSQCGITDHIFRYKLTFMASDGTAEAEIFCFDNIAKAIIGKPCPSVISSSTNLTAIPPEIAAIVSLKFTFVVIFNQRSFSGPKKVLLIKSIVEAHGRQRSLPYLEDNTQSMHPSTPIKLASITKQQDSPSLAMSQLSTEVSPTVSRILTYSPSKQATPVNSPKDKESNVADFQVHRTKDDIHKVETLLPPFGSLPKRLKQDGETSNKDVMAPKNKA